MRRFLRGATPIGTGKGLQIDKLLATGHWASTEFRIPVSDKFPACWDHGAWG